MHAALVAVEVKAALPRSTGPKSPSANIWPCPRPRSDHPRATRDPDHPAAAGRPGEDRVERRLERRRASTSVIPAAVAEARSAGGRVAIRAQSARRASIGMFAESIPSSATPRRMNGRTVVSSFAPPALPDDATAAPGRSVRRTYGSVAAPTVSTAPAQRADSSGRGLSAVHSSRGTIPAAPSARSRSSSSALPVAAQTSWPRAGEDRDRDAPDAAARPGHEHRSVARRAGRAARAPRRDIAAVNPAVPIAIASRAVEPRRQRHDVAGRQPRERAVPAVAGDAEVVAVGEDRLADARTPDRREPTTSPARSIPGISGLIRATLPSAIVASAVLVVDARPVDPDLDLAGRQVGRARTSRTPRTTVAPRGRLGDERAECGGDGGHARRA